MTYELNEKMVKDVSEYWRDRMPMMLMEEAGELIQAVSKYERKVMNPKPCEGGVAKFIRSESLDEEMKYRVIEEMRDMYISMAAIQQQYGITPEEINKEIEKKLNKKY